MPSYTDQLKRTITLPNLPARIVSLVPSLTELLFDLGLEEEVVGITKFCIHPEQWFRSKTRIGGTKNVHIDKVRELQPDLIIANKEENVAEQVHALEQIAPVWISDIGNIKDALQMIQNIGDITGRSEKAAMMVMQLKNDLAEIQSLTASVPKIRTAYLIWKDPYMTIGSDTFIHEILSIAGLENVFAGRTRYPEITLDEIRSNGTELVLLSSEPYLFQQKHIEELSGQLPGIHIALADGEMFSWYGSRMLQLLPYLRSFLPGITGDKS